MRAGHKRRTRARWLRTSMPDSWEPPWGESASSDRSDQAPTTPGRPYARIRANVRSACEDEGRIMFAAEGACSGSRSSCEPLLDRGDDLGHREAARLDRDLAAPVERLAAREQLLHLLQRARAALHGSTVALAPPA